jgi:hypothetical protein
VFNPEQRQQLVQIAKGLKAAQGDEGLYMEHAIGSCTCCKTNITVAASLLQ